MAIETVIGFVDGDPVIYQEEEPSRYETTAEVEDKPAYDVEIAAEDDHGNVGMIHSMFFVGGQWIPPIWQRTQADVNYVLRLNEQIARSGWSSLTEEEKNDWAVGLIGCLNFWDLNRIEINTDVLLSILYGYGYGLGQLDIKTDWIMEDFPYAAELERVRGNVQHLIDIYYEQEVPLPVTLEKPDYIMINSVERVLQLMYEMIDRMVDAFVYSGEITCGQGVTL